MSEPDPEAWTETMTARERVQSVVELLDEPASIEEIHERADVSRNATEEELDRLVAGGVVDVVMADGAERFRVDPVRVFFDEIQRLIESHTREELGRELDSMVGEVESLRDEFASVSTEAHWRGLSSSDYSADEMHEVSNAVSTWRALESDIWLFRRALQLYEDVTRLQEGLWPVDGGESLPKREDE